MPAADVPGAPWFLRSLAATTLAVGGDRQSSRAMWQAIRESAEIDWLRKDAERRLVQLQALDMADALHPQTFLTWGMNDGDLPVSFGGPLRMRVPRQLGYKSVKYITRLTVTDNLKPFGKGLGSASPESGYAWYAGI